MKEKTKDFHGELRNFNRKDKERYGCDYCKIDKPTELFEGYRGGKLWICTQCQKKLRKK